MKYAEVAVNFPLAQPRTFSYAIPPNISLSEGYAVWVPFGPRLAQGIVLALSDYPAVEDTKEIVHTIDSQPILSPHQVRLCRWIAEHYLSSYFEAASLMLPPGFERRVITYVQPTPAPSEAALSSLTARQRRVLYLLQQKGKIKLKELRQLGEREKVEALLEQLVRKGLAVKTRELERAKVSPRMEKYLSLAIPAEQAGNLVTELQLRRATKQAQLLDFLVRNPGQVPLSEARKQLGITSEMFKTLNQRGLISVQEVRIQRDPLADRTYAPTTPPTLTAAQEEAWGEIQAAMENISAEKSSHIKTPPVFLPPPVFLLHGVTGSGKTEIYLRALEKAVALGKRAIVLVPEIALTPQTISRFAARFPSRVAVLHSKLSLGEQYDVWQRVKKGDFDVVIGSRGALFAPQPDLGLIVMDEEHEWTYKQHEQAPRYHARDVAVKLAALTDSVLILGSATPDITSYYHGQQGRFKLLQLPQRISSGEVSALPRVDIVDLRLELKEGNRSIFSRALSAAVADSLAAREQVILFLNRRGAATFVQCRDCGLVLRCRRCDVSLTYHAPEDDLICHHCNYRTKVPHVCPDCLSKRIKFLGIGTQKVEEEVAKSFPGARLLRWDRDVTRGKHSHEQIMTKFLSHEADILIGTEYISYLILAIFVIISISKEKPFDSR